MRNKLRPIIKTMGSTDGLLVFGPFLPGDVIESFWVSSLWDSSNLNIDPASGDVTGNLIIALGGFAIIPKALPVFPKSTGEFDANGRYICSNEASGGVTGSMFVPGLSVAVFPVNLEMDSDDRYFAIRTTQAGSGVTVGLCMEVEDRDEQSYQIGDAAV